MTARGETADATEVGDDGPAGGGAGVRCAAWARAEGLVPAGTAGSPLGFAVVDWPLPWPRDIADIGGLAGAHAVARDHGLRVQLRAWSPGRPARITIYRRPGGGFVRYAVDESEVGGDGGDRDDRGGAGVEGAAVTATLRRLLDRPAAVGDLPVRGEILVCTHGRRDTCCGSSGTALFAELAAAGDGDRPVGRTSHTGGHRFAPTALVLPEGTLWAFADPDLLGRVVARRGPVADAAARYRGCAGLDGPALQAVEGAVLGEVGWGLLDQERTGEDLGGGRIRLRVGARDGAVSVWEAEVVAGRTLAVPDCGRPLEAATKSETERVVRELRRLP